MKCLEYPFDVDYLMKKKKSIRRELLADGQKRAVKKIAVLGGSTTSEIVVMLELFLLNMGIEPQFYQSEYNQFYEDAMFGNPELAAFSPDLIYIHTSNRNLTEYPRVADTLEAVEQMITGQLDRFTAMWGHLYETYHCPIIQNNMELPLYRLLGNQDGVLPQGRTAYIRRINQGFAAYGAAHNYFYLHDLEYLASDFGLSKFSDPFYWHMYKYCMCLQAIPEFAYSLAAMIGSIFGKNKKGLVLDLDNTLWGGVIGDDGPEGIELGQETSIGQVYSEFQTYVKDLKQIGVVLSVNSKNEEENALAGLNAPYSVLKPEDFLVIKANWEPKDRNFAQIADEIGILPESMVFVDDNPAERSIVAEQLPGVLAPEIGQVEQYARILDRGRYFEVTTLSEDDKKRNEMYRENIQRSKLQAAYTSYEDYLKSLEMKAQILPFDPMYLARIAQLTNKSNQFNLTTRRYTQTELEELAKREDVITLYGKLEDRFGDSGIVSVLIGHKEGQDELHMDLWLMSCRVLKRDMECAMMDQLAEMCKKVKIRKIFGYYYRTEKNNMVRYFYGDRRFTLLEEAENGDSKWMFEIPEEYVPQNKVITINEDRQ